MEIRKQISRLGSALSRRAKAVIRSNSARWSAAGIVSLAALYWPLVVLGPDQSQALAAWVQAIGSVGAVFFAIQLANKQSKQAEKARIAETVEAEDKLLDGIRGMVLGSQGTLEKAIAILLEATASRDIKIADSVSKAIQSISTGLDSINLPVIGNQDIVQTLIELKLLTNEIQQAIERINGYHTPSSFESLIRPSSLDIRKLRERITQQVEKIMSQTRDAHNRLERHRANHKD